MRVNKTAKIIRYAQYVKDALGGNGIYASKYRFTDRRQHKGKMLYVLAGYKPYLWKDVFSRIDAYLPTDVEVCVLSSGKYLPQLEDYCEQYGWSYLSTTRNNICCITNIMMKIYNDVEYVFKMDEDIYLTEGAFEGLESCYHKLEKERRYEIGMVGAFIPINSFCIYKFLNEVGKYDDFVEKYGWINDGCMYDEQLRRKPGINAYIWNETGDIDAFARNHRSMEPGVYDVNVRYMIGFVLYKRSLWESIGGLRVMAGKGSGDEGDEGQFLSHCFLTSKAVFVAKNVVVGHFSYGGAEEEVMRVKKSHPDWFALKERNT